MYYDYDYDNCCVILNDNKRYALDAFCAVETVCDAQHEDWKTVIAQDIQPIPKGTQLKVNKVWQNLYGRWVQVLYDGRYYDLCPRNLKYIGRKTI